MKRAITLAAFCGLATAAAGQSLTVTLSFDKTNIGLGETVTATLSASFTGHPAGAYLSSVNIDLIASFYSVEVSNVAAVAWNNPGLGFSGQGTGSGADVLGIEASQFSLIPPITAGSPVLITTFTLTGTCGAGAYLDYTAQATADAPFAFSVTGGGFSDPIVGYGPEVLQVGRLLVCPSPGSAGVVAAGLAVGLRRRR